jgi:hypothetical protein
MKRGSGFTFSEFPVWIIPPMLLLFFALASGFNGLYGQDSFEYLRYSRAIHTFLTQGTYPGTFFWPVLYPLSGALLSFILPDILSLQLISIVSYGFTCFFLGRILQHLYPGKQKETRLYIMLFFCLSPFILRYSLTIMSEPMTLLFITAFFYYWLVFTDGKRQKYFMGVVFFGCAAVNTRYPAFIILIIPFLHSVFNFFRRFNPIVFAASLVIVLLIFLPGIWMKIVEPGSILGRSDFLYWSWINYFKRSFITTDGTKIYMLPNICYVFKNLIHPGYIFAGLLFLFFIRKEETRSLFFRILLLVILVYALFLAGLPFQNDRVLLLSFPLVVILFSCSFITLTEKYSLHLQSQYPESSFSLSRRGSQKKREVSQKIDNLCINFAKLCDKLCATLRETAIFRPLRPYLKHLVIISVIVVQMILFYGSFRPFYRNNKTTKTIALKMLEYPGRKIYTFNIDMALKGYGVTNETVNLWSNKIDFFEPGGLVLLNFADSQNQWKGMNPMLNWERLTKTHHLKVVESFPEGWNLYEITN